MSRVLLFDTNVWSHLLLGTPEKRLSVQARLRQLGELYPGATQATSRLCIAEALVGARRLLDPEAARQAEGVLRAAFDSPSLIIVEITDLVAHGDVQVLDLAAALRSEALRAVARRGGPSAGPDGGKLKLPDAIIAASCMAFSPPAVLVTENAADFRAVSPAGEVSTVAGLTFEAL
jgi:predicted nucleic acid-binding protein